MCPARTTREGRERERTGREVTKRRGTGREQPYPIKRAQQGSSPPLRVVVGELIDHPSNLRRRAPSPVLRRLSAASPTHAPPTLSLLRRRRGGVDLAAPPPSPPVRRSCTADTDAASEELEGEGWIWPSHRPRHPSADIGTASEELKGEWWIWPSHVPHSSSAAPSPPTPALL